MGRMGGRMKKEILLLLSNLLDAVEEDHEEKVIDLLESIPIFKNIKDEQLLQAALDVIKIVLNYFKFQALDTVQIENAKEQINKLSTNNWLIRKKAEQYATLIEPIGDIPKGEKVKILSSTETQVIFETLTEPKHTGWAHPSKLQFEKDETMVR